MALPHAQALYLSDTASRRKRERDEECGVNVTETHLATSILVPNLSDPALRRPGSLGPTAANFSHELFAA